jgi:hypothetical protein
MIIFWIAQAFGLLGLLCNTLSYQFRKRTHILLMQSSGSVFFATHFFLLGAISGGLLNIIGFFRATVSAAKDRWHIPSALLNGIFIPLYLLSYVSVFTLFGKQTTLPNLIIELLPVTAMIVSTVGFSVGNAKSVRIYSSIASPFWLTYNGISLSIGGVCSEILCLSSAILGFLRHDHIKHQKEDSNI